MTGLQSRCLPGPWRLTGALCPVASPFAPLLFAGRLEEGLRALGDLNYDAVELGLRHPSEVDAQWLQESLARTGLALSTVSVGRMFYEQGLSITAPEEEKRRACVEQLRTLLQFAARFGSALTIGGVRGVLPRDSSAGGLRASAVDALRQVAEEGIALDVVLLVEPINRYETNFINTASEALDLLKEVDRPNVKLLLDTFHMNIEEESLPDAIRLVGERLAYVHLADSNRRAPGCGHTDLAAVMEALVEIGFDGYLGMEILPLPDDHTAARLGRENTQKLAARFVR